MEEHRHLRNSTTGHITRKASYVQPIWKKGRRHKERLTPKGPWAHPYAVLRPRAPPLEAAARREFVYDETAAPGRAVGLVVDEALVREHLPRAAAAYADSSDHGEACEVATSRQSSVSHQPVSHQTVGHRSLDRLSPVISQSPVTRQSVTGHELRQSVTHPHRRPCAVISQSVIGQSVTSHQSVPNPHRQPCGVVAATPPPTGRGPRGRACPGARAAAPP